MKLVLFVGFGGLLSLMALAGLDFIRASHRIETEDVQITGTYLKCHRLLDQIRSSLYLSGAFVRDYLLEQNPETVTASLAQLRGLRAQTKSALQEYSQSLNPDEQKLFSELKTDINGYWNTLEPAFEWSPQEKATRGPRYFRMQVVPRRAVLITIADKIEAMNERALADGASRAMDSFRRLRRRVFSILGLTLGLGTILAAASIIHILNTDRESRLRYDEIRRTQEELKSLSARLVEAQEQERRSISRELHDQVGQSLNALRVDLSNLAAITPPDNPEAHHFLNTARTLADESIKTVRNMALLLRPSMLDDLGLVAALGWQGREVSRRTGLRIDVIADDVPEELPEEHKTCIYRVVQEALQNASRHADAHMVRVALRPEGEHLLLEVQDDGKGFDPRCVRGLGLLGMEERVNHLGGSFQVSSQLGQGTLVEVSLPVPALCLDTQERPV